MAKTWPNASLSQKDDLHYRSLQIKVICGNYGFKSMISKEHLIGTNNFSIISPHCFFNMTFLAKVINCTQIVEKPFWVEWQISHVENLMVGLRMGRRDWFIHCAKMSGSRLGIWITHILLLSFRVKVVLAFANSHPLCLTENYSNSFSSAGADG